MFNRKALVNMFSLIAVFLWMALIFKFSSQVVKQSNALSGEVTKIVIETVEKINPERAVKIDVRRLNHLIRKKAHFFAYLVLGLLVANTVKRSKIYGIKGIIISSLICFLYAVSDEIHQLFVPGRGAQVKDVLIDSTGAVTGILLYLGIYRLRIKGWRVRRNGARH